jgi:melibiase-like protein
MDRRTFVLLTGTVSLTAFDPPRRPGAARAAPAGRLRFELDDQRRWSLWYYGAARPVPLIRNAELVAWVGDQPITLAQLEDSTVGNRRPPGGEAVVVRGLVAGVWVEAEFLVAPAADAPQAAVTVTIFPDRYLPTLTGVRFFRLPEGDVLPGGTEPLVALVNGYHSRDACRVAAVGGSEGGGGAGPNAPGLVSHGALGLTRGGQGLGIAFDAGEPGEAKVRLSSAGLEAVSDWAPPRPLRPEGDTSRLRICYQPDGDGLEALRAAFVPASPLDQERLAQAVAPAGWYSACALGGDVTETGVVANAAFAAAHFDRRFFRVIRLDDGYQKAAGDWEANERFPHGHRWLTDQIHATGFKAALWLAPFAVSERSGVPAAHPDWLLRDAGSAPLVWDTREAWGDKVYALDGAHPKVQQWLFELARTVVRDWGYDSVEIDALRCATAGAGHYGGLTHAEAYRAGLGAIRDGLGTEAFLLAGDAPLQHAVGLVNGMRVGPDGDVSWSGVQAAARAAGLRSFYQRGAWLNDPGCLAVRAPLTGAEAQAWTSVVALSGGLTLLSDDLPALPADRIALLARALPVAPVAGRPVGATAPERDVAPALVAGADVYPIGGPWRFRTGDDPRYAALQFDEEAWETIAVPGRWRDAGHADYDGIAWYRTRFSLPPVPSGRSRAVEGGQGRSMYLELGKIADEDETYVNGEKIGHSGEPQAYRRYLVPPELLNWGGDNVLAVRVSGGRAGGGGIWSVRRDRPPRVWVAEGAPRWWTVALVNWEDDPQDIAVPLATLGIAGARFDAYDVWRDVPLAAPTDTLSATLEPRSTLAVAIRPAAARPQVIGTTRHVVQGAVDLVDETWDAATRTLRAKAVNLDSRAYAVTISVPRGMRPGGCKADVPCTVKRLESGHAVLSWAAGGDGRDIKWEIGFRSSTGLRKGKD